MGLQVVVEEMLLNRLLPGKKQPQPTNVMTESWATLVAAQVSIAELAAVLRICRSTVGGHSIQISHQLEMAELDLLSARDALEKACWEMDLTVEPGDVRSPEPPAVSDSVPSAPPAGSLVANDIGGFPHKGKENCSRSATPSTMPPRLYIRNCRCTPDSSNDPEGMVPMPPVVLGRTALRATKPDPTRSAVDPGRGEGKKRRPHRVLDKLSVSSN
jgi:hypothetical protein